MSCVKYKHDPPFTVLSLFFFSKSSAVVTAMDGGGEGGDGKDAGEKGGGGNNGGVSMPRRSGRQSDLLLEVEALEPQQLMSVRGLHIILSC